MSVKKHLQLLVYSFVTWFTFYLIGLPDYYQSWWFEVKVAICVLVTLAYIPGTYYTLKTFWDDGEHLTNSLWLAFYLTVPLFTYGSVASRLQRVRHWVCVPLLVPKFFLCFILGRVFPNWLVDRAPGKKTPRTELASPLQG